MKINGEKKKEKSLRDIPGGPVVKTLHFHSKGHRFNLWSGNYDLLCLMAQPKKKKNPLLKGVKMFKFRL